MFCHLRLLKINSMYYFLIIISNILSINFPSSSPKQTTIIGSKPTLNFTPQSKSLKPKPSSSSTVPSRTFVPQRVHSTFSKTSKTSPLSKTSPESFKNNTQKFSTDTKMSSPRTESSSSSAATTSSYPKTSHLSQGLSVGLALYITASSDRS